MFTISATQKGYMPATLAAPERPLHDTNEDYTRTIKVAKTNATPAYSVVIVCDGHAGDECAIFVGLHIVSRVLALLASLNDQKTPVTWCFQDGFPNVKVQLELEAELCRIFTQVDRMYIQKKINEFRNTDQNLWACGVTPIDDGCSCLINIICPGNEYGNGWLINANIGDSRTVLMQLSTPNNESKFSKVLFASRDHNMLHPERLRFIHENGGRFLDPRSLRQINAAPLLYPVNNSKALFDSFSSSFSSESDLDDTADVFGLEYARIYRQASSVIQEIGCSSRKTLNLSATMGDLVFKIHPAIMSSSPDVSFVQFNTTFGDVAILCATDGLFDHMISDEQITQNMNLASVLHQFVDPAISKKEALLVEDGYPSPSSTIIENNMKIRSSNSTHSMLYPPSSSDNDSINFDKMSGSEYTDGTRDFEDRICDFAEALTEGRMESLMSNLFEQRPSCIGRLDDCTVSICYIPRLL